MIGSTAAKRNDVSPNHAVPLLDCAPHGPHHFLYQCLLPVIEQEKTFDGEGFKKSSNRDLASLANTNGSLGTVESGVIGSERRDGLDSGTHESVNVTAKKGVVD